MRLAILQEDLVFRLPRPPVFFEELRSIAVRNLPGAIEVDEESDRYLAFREKWSGYVPDVDDIKRSEAYRSRRSLAARAGDLGRGLVGITVAFMGTRAREEIEADRIAKCAVCPHYRPGMWAVETCAVCGCILFAKRKDPNARCPDTPPRWVEEAATP